VVEKEREKEASKGGQRLCRELVLTNRQRPVPFYRRPEQLTAHARRRLRIELVRARLPETGRSLIVSIVSINNAARGLADLAHWHKGPPGLATHHRASQRASWDRPGRLDRIERQGFLAAALPLVISCERQGLFPGRRSSFFFSFFYLFLLNKYQLISINSYN
jgi:hypothetical protein